MEDLSAEDIKFMKFCDFKSEIDNGIRFDSYNSEDIRIVKGILSKKADAEGNHMSCLIEKHKDNLSIEFGKVTSGLFSLLEAQYIENNKFDIERFEKDKNTSLSHFAFDATVHAYGERNIIDSVYENNEVAYFINTIGEDFKQYICQYLDKEINSYKEIMNNKDDDGNAIEILKNLGKFDRCICKLELGGEYIDKLDPLWDYFIPLKEQEEERDR